MEEWKTIEYLEYKYAASNFGRVKNVKTNRILKSREFKNTGYQRINITLNKKSMHFYVHRLILSTFKPIDNPDDFEADHINFDRSNNKLENLQWLSSKQNNRKRIRNNKSFVTYSNLLIKFGDEKLDEILSSIK